MRLVIDPQKQNGLELILRFLVMLEMLSIFLFPDNANQVFKYGIRIAFLCFFCFSIFINRIKINGFHFMWAGLFSSICLLNILFSSHPEESNAYLFLVLQAIWSSVLLAAWMIASKSYDYVLKLIIVFSLLYCGRIVAYLGTVSWGHRKIGTMLGTNVNAIGLRLAISFIISLYYFYQKQDRVRFLYLFSGFVFLGFILVTGSRRALIMIVLSFAAFAVFRSKNISKLLQVTVRIALLLVVIGFLAIKIPALYNIIGARMERIIRAFFEGETILDNGRAEMIKAGIDLFYQRPVTGWGMNCFRIVSGFDHAYCHNNYVELLFAMGFPGLIAYYIPVIYLILKNRLLEHGSLEKLFIYVLIINYLISDLASANYTSLLTQLFIVISLALVIVKTREGSVKGTEEVNR